MVHATVPQSFRTFCNITASNTRLAAQMIQDLMVLLREWLMDKAGKEGKPWILGLFDYRITPQSGSIASPVELMTQCTPREKHLPQLPSALGAPEMYQTCQELTKRQGNSNKPERHYVELFPGTPVWVQHRQNATWEPASVISQAAPTPIDSPREWCRTTQGI